MTRYKLTLEYQGHDYAGWQRQKEHPSIQQALEEAVKGFSGQVIKIHSAGRTDAGVHAQGQVAHMDLAPLKKPIQPSEIAKAINAHLRPQLISVLKIEQVADDFHARFHATNKLYHYRIINRPAFLTLDHGRAWHARRPLDVEAMDHAAKILLGAHDFTSFRDSECQARSPMKTLDRLDVKARPYDDCGGQEILFETEGKSFLHHQVRNMVGSLSLVGLGKWSLEDLRTALNARDRTKGGPTAPAEGLALVRVDYGRSD